MDKKSNVINMGPVEPVKEVKQPEQVNSEKLVQLCAQLSTENKKMYNYINNIDRDAYFKRIDYMFKIIENYAIFPEAVVNRAIAEVEKLLFDGEPESTDEVQEKYPEDEGQSK